MIVRNRLKVLMNKDPEACVRRPSAATKVSPGGYATQSLAQFEGIWSKLPGLRVFFKGSCQGNGKFGAALGGPTSP